MSAQPGSPWSLKVLPLTFPVASLEEYQMISANPPLHSEIYTIPMQMWICPKFKVMWFPWLFIPIFHEADHRKQWKSSVKEIKQRLHFRNYTVISWILVSWNVPFGIYFPAARMRLERKKGHLKHSLVEKVAILSKPAETTVVWITTPPDPLQHEHIHVHIQK